MAKKLYVGNLPWSVTDDALAEMFAEHPHVEKFFAAPQAEGGAGATIVELKV